MNSPLAIPTPAAMIPGPMTLRKLDGGSGMSRRPGGGRCLVGKFSTTDDGGPPGRRAGGGGAGGGSALSRGPGGGRCLVGKFSTTDDGDPPESRVVVMVSSLNVPTTG